MLGSTGEFEVSAVAATVPEVYRAYLEKDGAPDALLATLRDLVRRRD